MTSPRDPVIAKSQALQARLDGMRQMAEVFFTQLEEGVRELILEVEQHTEGEPGDRGSGD